VKNSGCPGRGQGALSRLWVLTAGGDDVLALTQLVQDEGAEGGLVEHDRLGGPIHPQLGLDAGHGDFRGQLAVACWRGVGKQ
jgi:hypothetical protein